MDALIELLERLRDNPQSRGQFRAMLHILIGRRVIAPDGRLVSAGMTYRDVASLLKKIRWNPDDVAELGIDPKSLPPRDRQRYWFSALCQAKVDAADAAARADELAAILKKDGYIVGPAPGQGRSA